MNLRTSPLFIVIFVILISKTVALSVGNGGQGGNNRLFVVLFIIVGLRITFWIWPWERMKKDLPPTCCYYFFDKSPPSLTVQYKLPPFRVVKQDEEPSVNTEKYVSPVSKTAFTLRV
ncbi:hypothetical protein CAEBREN_22632 [Caenorhabditis brenneri]|uniref:Uncharacterized protein n=1 Tax=Caenorhabditis brenneri TaxID=135651 RepID=G0NTZ1_CAEBE|nr:hypothetical protein CAEBREN_22632 [Caenorhabditis brenneri]